MAYFGVGILSLRQGALPKALPLLERALEICRGQDIPIFFAWIASLLGYTLALAGQITKALPLLEQAVDQVTGKSIRFSQSLWTGWLSEAYFLAGRQDDARTHAEWALQLSREYNERGHQAYALRLLGEIYSHHHPPDSTQAENYYQQALTLATELDMCPLQAHCHRGLGVLYSKTRQGERARSELSMAIDLYRSMKMTFWLPQTEEALAQMV